MQKLPKLVVWMIYIICVVIVFRTIVFIIAFIAAFMREYSNQKARQQQSNR